MLTLRQTIDIYAGGPGSGCNPAAGKCGRDEGPGQQRVSMGRQKLKSFKPTEHTGPINKAKQERAKSSYNAVTPEKIRVAKAMEDKVAKAVGGISYADNHPYDILVGKRVGLEVKTIFPGAKNDKITMHPDSRKRKEAYAKDYGLKKIGTVVIDQRSGSNKIYYKEGVGAYRLKNMQALNGFNDLAKAIKK